MIGTSSTPFSAGPSVTLASPRRVSSEQEKIYHICDRYPGDETIVASYCLLLAGVWNPLFLCRYLARLFRPPLGILVEFSFIMRSS